MRKAFVIRCQGDEVSDWEAEHTYFLECRNCGAFEMCVLPEPHESGDSLDDQKGNK